MKLDSVAPLIIDPPLTSFTNLPLVQVFAGIKWRGRGQGGAKVEAVVKNLVVDLAGDMVGDIEGSKVGTQSKIIAFNLFFTPGDV